MTHFANEPEVHNIDLSDVEPPPRDDDIAAEHDTADVPRGWFREATATEQDELDELSTDYREVK